MYGIIYTSSLTFELLFLATQWQVLVLYLMLLDGYELVYLLELQRASRRSFNLMLLENFLLGFQHTAVLDCLSSDCSSSISFTFPFPLMSEQQQAQGTYIEPINFCVRLIFLGFLQLYDF